MNRSTRVTHPTPTTRRVLFAVAGLLALATAGPRPAWGQSAREAYVRNGVRDGLDRIGSTLTASPCAREVLARHGLARAWRGDPAGAALQLEASLSARPGAEPDGPVALAELWYRAGLGHLGGDPAAALVCFRDAAAAAVLALTDPRSTCFDDAVALHNDALARLVRLAQDERVHGGEHWMNALARSDVNCTAAQPFLAPARFETLTVCDDVRVKGMRNVYRTGGLGVPLVALRPVDREHPAEAEEEFYPPRLRVCTTVVALPGGGLAGGAWRTAPLSLVFHDPFATRALDARGRAVPLARDTTTALAVQVSQGVLRMQTTLGLFLSDFQTGIKPGLYMLRPWQPGKIPVVFVHGLNSNPAAFVQVINDLRNDPVVGARYQFLLFAYPTGRAIPYSAMKLRAALYEAERRFGGDPAFRRMVVAGHSMGGILTRAMVTDSGMNLWNAVLTVPPDRLRAAPEHRALLENMLIYRPVPFVRRAVFIAAPHRGSRIADEPLGRTIRRLVRPNDEQTQIIERLKADNGENVIHAEILRDRSINSIGNLSPQSPVLTSVADLPVAPGVAHHTIAFRFAGMAPTDLVVPAWSSFLPGVESHAEFHGTHFSEQSRDTIGELRRILIEHLDTPAAN